MTTRLDPDNRVLSSVFFWEGIKTVKINSKGPVVQAAERERKKVDMNGEEED